MKKLILALCLLASIKANTQPATVDTSIKFCVATKIVPFVYKHGIPQLSDTITHLGVFWYTAKNDSVWSVNYTFISANSKPYRNVDFGWIDAPDVVFLPYYNGDFSSLLFPLAGRFGVTLLR